MNEVVRQLLDSTTLIDNVKIDSILKNDEENSLNHAQPFDIIFHKSSNPKEKHSDQFDIVIEEEDCTNFDNCLERFKSKAFFIGLIHGVLNTKVLGFK